MGNDNEWLTRLKIGDEVAVYHSGFYGRYEFLKVTAESAKFWTVGGNRYRKEDGRKAGDHYGAHLEELTQELRAEEAAKQRHRFLTNKIENVRWRSLPIETLEAVSRVLEASNEQSVSASAVK